MEPAIIMTDSSITAYIDGNTYTLNVQENQEKFDNAVQLIKQKQWDSFIELVNKKVVLTKYIRSNDTAKDIEIKNGNFYYGDQLMHSYLVNKILEMYENDFDITALCNFFKNLQQNPSNRAVKELYEFLEKGEMPITEDGYFVAYKKVRPDFKDIYSGKFDNSVGSICEMPRNEVNDVSSVTCSTGLHFCSKSYLSKYGTANSNIVVIVKINPADVVAIPTDYNLSKGRTCRYEVIGTYEENYTDDLSSYTVYPESQDDLEQDEWEDDWEDYEDYWED